MSHMLINLTVAFSSCIAVQTDQAKNGAPKRPEAGKPRVSSLSALKPYSVLVGDWRGIGLPKRSSRRGAWTEKASGVWRVVKGKPPVLVLTSSKSKLVTRLELRFDEKKQQLGAAVQLVGEKMPILLVAKGTDAKKLVFEESPAKASSKSEDKRGGSKGSAANKHRVTLRLLSEKRILLLVERGAARFQRVAEIGYTRAGSSIVTRKSGGPECVVTGGAGTISVTYKGKTYYVCCSGCQQAFNDDPEGVLADYRARVAAEEAKAAGKPEPK